MRARPTVGFLGFRGGLGRGGGLPGLNMPDRSAYGETPGWAPTGLFTESSLGSGVAARAIAPTPTPGAATERKGALVETLADDFPPMPESLPT